VLYADTSRPELPYTGSAGNPKLLPMLSDQLDIAYQWYFGKSNLLSAAVFFKDIKRYIGLKTENGTINGHDSKLYQSVNTEGGQVRGVEFIYQQAFTNMPAPFNNTGIYSNYTYTQSNIKEPGDGTNPFALSGLVPHNAGLTLWYEKNGLEGRLAVNYKSKSTRNPYWTAVEGFVTDSASTWVALNFSKKLNDNFQVHFGIDNLTDQKSIFQTGTQYQQRIEDTGRRYNFGVSYKM
jgi:TonB-dependent receptor